MSEVCLHNRQDSSFSRLGRVSLTKIIKDLNESTLLLFLLYILFLCLIHVEDPQTILMLQERDKAAWLSLIFQGLSDNDYLKPFFLGILLYISGADISKTQLNELWSDSSDDITPAEIRNIYGNIFAVRLGEPGSFSTSKQQRITYILEQSEVFKNAPLPKPLELYVKLATGIPIFLPAWCEVIPPNLTPSFGIQSLKWMNAIRHQARERCPSLRHIDKALFLPILASFNSYPPKTQRALNEWATSSDGRKWRQTWMNVFQLTKEPSISLLLVAVFLSVPAYCNMPLPSATFTDPLLDLSSFVEEQGSNGRMEVLEKMALSAIRVLMDEQLNNIELPKAQQNEYKYLTEVIDNTIQNVTGTLGPLEGSLDGYWKGRIIRQMDHDNAFHHASSLLLSAIQPRHSLRSISRVSSCSTLRGSACGEIYHARKAACDSISNSHFLSCFSEEDQVEQQSVRIVPDHVFGITVVGAFGVGKSKVVDRIIHRRYIRAYDPTVEDKHSVTLSIHGTLCKFNIVDTAGQDLYSTTHQRLHDEQSKAALQKDALIIVYDTTSMSSFANIRMRFNPNEHPPHIITMLVGNKVDKGQRQVQQYEAIKLAREFDGTFLEVSARTGVGVGEILPLLGCLLLQRRGDQPNGNMTTNLAVPKMGFLSSISATLKNWTCLGSA